MTDAFIAPTLRFGSGATPPVGATPTVREQQARILFALGVMAYASWDKRSHRIGESLATGCFDRVVDEAKGRGFKGRKQLVGAARRGRGTPFAIQKMQEACSFLTEAETALHLGRAAAWVHFAETGSQMPGWSFRDPAETRAGTEGAPRGRA